MSKWNVVHEHESDSGFTRISQNEKGDVKIDSYIGNPRDPDNHDRLTVNTEKGNMEYHGFYHEPDVNNQKNK